MDLWFLYWVLSALFAWLASFLLKVSAEKDYNYFLFSTYSFFTWGISAFICYLFSWVYIEEIFLVIILSIMMWLSYFVVFVLRLEALQNISTTFYFLIYKVFSGIWAVIVWILFFKDILALNEIIWISLWLSVPFFIMNGKDKWEQKNLYKWVILCLLSGVFVLVSVFIWKIINLYEFNLFFYVFVWWIVWWIASLFQYKRSKLKQKTKFKIKRVAMLNWFLTFISSYFFLKALSWNVWVVYTINSFSILIPIILSIIFYSEKLNLRKITAIALTILSMLFFKVF